MKKTAAVMGPLLIIGAAVMRIWFVGFHVVPQNGMYPTIPQQSVVFSWKHPYRAVSDVVRGDVVVFERFEGGHRYLYIWRVVGLPGDRLSASKDKVFLNGSPLERAPVRDDGALGVFRERVGGASYEVAIAKHPEHVPPDVAVVVGPDELFVLGDNRYEARDSRYFGPIKFSSVVGRKI
jgi:signal peptidase I